MSRSKSLLVVIGGVTGAGCRWVLQSQFAEPSGGSIHWAILLVNVAGCFVLGVILGKKVKENLYLLLGAGFCGGLTTFSTFAVDAASLLKDSYLKEAIIYIFLSVIISMFSFLVGNKAGKEWQ
ncbi:MAG: fluoride efflux transporter CrcB [Acidimicrobiaceae bacterium]|nr:fluoride efflux transporter CrcB [Acidimicrobiaceae bacterium]